MSRHPLGGALRVSEEPLRAAFLAGVTRLCADTFSLQIENVGLDESVGAYRPAHRLSDPSAGDAHSVAMTTNETHVEVFIPHLHRAMLHVDLDRACYCMSTGALLEGAVTRSEE